MTRFFIDKPVTAITGNSNLRMDFQNGSGRPVKIFSLTIKIDTSMADPRLAYAEVGRGPDGSTKIIAIGFASGFNDFEKRLSPPVELPPGYYMAVHGYGDVGTNVGCQYEADDSLNDKGVSQF